MCIPKWKLNESHYAIALMILFVASIFASMGAIYNHIPFESDYSNAVVALGFIAMLGGFVGFFMTIPKLIKARKPKTRDSRKK